MIKTTAAALLSSGVLAAAAVLLAASLIAAPEATARPGDLVEYIVSSDGPLKDVWYSDQTEQIQIVTGPPAKWSTMFIDTTETPSTYVVAAWGSDTQKRLSCQIKINGVLATQDSGFGSLACNKVGA